MSAKKNIPTEETISEQQTQTTGKKTVPRVYCGPDVRSTARQFTVYSGELPQALREFIKEHPAAAGLVVEIDRFAEFRRRVEIPGTAENILYKKVKAEM